LKQLNLDGAVLHQLAVTISALETAGYMRDPSSIIESEIVAGAKEALSRKGFTLEQIALMGDDAETRKAARVLVRARGIQKAL
jgi:hypothetical protein